MVFVVFREILYPNSLSWAIGKLSQKCGGWHTTAKVNLTNFHHAGYPVHAILNLHEKAKSGSFH